MAFIGNTPTTQAFTPAIDYFSGNGSTTAFTLSRPVASVAQVQVTIDNVAQNPSSAYTVSGSTITFTSAPLSGTNNIYVYYTSPITQVIAPGQGTVTTTSLNTSSLVIPAANVTGITPAMVSDQTNTSTGYFDLPAGTTAQRPGSPATGMIRYNTSTSYFEAYIATGWVFLSSTSYDYNIDYLVVAGGAGGGNDIGGGGGAGGYRTASSFTISGGTTYTVTVGAGGAAVTNGSDSVFGSITSTGGGAGATLNGAGSAGGSGGGSGGRSGSGGAGNTPSTSPSQGNNGGGPGSSPSSATDRGGGGGGASAVGAGGTASGIGGAGTASSITGSSVTYAGGGGGGSFVTGASGGAGGGGTGGNAGGAGSAGTANRGGGGGGGGSASGAGAAGGSGIVILAIPTTRYTGTTTGSPSVSTSGSNTILTYTSSGTYTA